MEQLSKLGDKATKDAAKEKIKDAFIQLAHHTVFIKELKDAMAKQDHKTIQEILEDVTGEKDPKSCRGSSRIL